MDRHPLALVLALLALLPAGCWKPRKLEPTVVEKKPETVRLLVVGDPALTEAIRRLKGEWHAVTGNRLEVDEAPGIAVEAGDRPPVQHDALIVPAAELGSTIVAGGIAPVPPELREDKATAWSDFFLLVQQGVNWGDEVWGVPLGQPPLTLLYRRELFEKFKKSPPTTWDEYQRLVTFFSSARIWAMPLRRRTLPGTPRWNRPLLVGPAGCFWPGRRLTPNIATITRRCSTSTRWSRSSPASRSSAPLRS